MLVELLDLRLTNFKWELMKSQYGECMVFESARHFPKPTQASGREAQLSLMVYNDAKDTMGGFNQLFTGLNGIKKTFT